MRKVYLAVVAGAMMLLLTAGVAWAATIQCDGGQCDGTSQDDSITGSQFADLIRGLAGSDEISGEGGDNTLLGNAGNDELEGGPADDTLRGQAGNDQVEDFLEGDVDNLFGGAGGDQLLSQDGDRFDSVNCGPGVDTAFVDAGDDVADNCESINPPGGMEE